MGIFLFNIQPIASQVFEEADDAHQSNRHPHSYYLGTHVFCYADFFASIKGPYNDIDGLRLVSSVFTVNNFDADELDQAELHGGALYEWRSGDWQL